MTNSEIYKKVLGMIDLTSLNSTDTFSKIRGMVDKVNGFHGKYPQYPLPASICVYPNFASTVAKARTSDDVHVTVVGGCFPASQSTLAVKVAECSGAVRDIDHIPGRDDSLILATGCQKHHSQNR